MSSSFPLPDRLAHVKAQLERSGIGYEIVTPVDGLDLDLDDPETAAAFASSDRNSDCFQAMRAGCALSHVSVYRRILIDGLDHALVLEDNVTPPGDLAALLDALSGHLSGAGVALLNFDSAQTCKLAGKVR